MSVELTKTSTGLSASTIKLIALIAMFIDHLAASLILYIFENGQLGQIEWLYQMLSMGETEPYTRLADIYYIMRNIGRISFPIYCFFIVEGFTKTSNCKKYALRLLICAFLSEIPFDYALFGKVMDFEHQNVFFTLFFGLLAIWTLKNIEDKLGWDAGIKTALSLICCIGFPFFALVLKTDYDFYGVTTILLMYTIRKRTEYKNPIWPYLTFSSGVVLLGFLSLSEFWAFIALPMFFFYQGKRGFKCKWFFYLFYPAHLLLFAVLRYVI